MASQSRMHTPVAYRSERDFLVRVHTVFGTPASNWGLERWNHARYFVVPLLSGMDAFESAFGRPLSEWERAWHAFLQGQFYPFHRKQRP